MWMRYKIKKPFTLAWLEKGVRFTQNFTFLLNSFHLAVFPNSNNWLSSEQIGNECEPQTEKSEEREEE